MRMISEVFVYSGFSLENFCKSRLADYLELHFRLDTSLIYYG